MRMPIGAVIVVLSGYASVASSAQQGKGNAAAEQTPKQELTAKMPGSNRDGQAWLELAVRNQNAARYRDAERAYRTAIRLLHTGNRRMLGNALDSLGTMYVECGALGKAERLERKALAIREQEQDIPAIGLSHVHLSALLLGQRKFARAEAEAKVGVKLLIRVGMPEQQINALIDLAVIRCASGECADALPELRQALAIAQRHYTSNSIPVGFVHFLLGYASWKSGDDDSGADLMRQGTRELATQLAWGHPMYLRAMRQYGTFLTQTGRNADADEVWASIAKFGSARTRVDVQSFLLP